MAVRRSYNNRGEQQAKRLREYIIKAVADKTGHELPITQTLDQLVRTAAHHGVYLVITASIR